MPKAKCAILEDRTSIRTKYSREIKNIRKLSGMKGAFACVLNHFRCVQFFATLWIVACQSPLSMGFSRREYWSVFPRPSLEDLPSSKTEPESPILAGRFFTNEPRGKPNFQPWSA